MFSYISDVIYTAIKKNRCHSDKSTVQHSYAYKIQLPNEKLPPKGVITSSDNILLLLQVQFAEENKIAWEKGKIKNSTVRVVKYQHFKAKKAAWFPSWAFIKS